MLDANFWQNKSLAQKVIKEHGGDIWAESKGLEKGSIFSFSLPICDNEECK